MILEKWLLSVLSPTQYSVHGFEGIMPMIRSGYLEMAVLVLVTTQHTDTDRLLLVISIIKYQNFYVFNSNRLKSLPVSSGITRICRRIEETLLKHVLCIF